MHEPAQLTERQAKWFLSVRNGLERDTGLTLDQWAERARQCPEHTHKKRLAWMKAHYGLGQNQASVALNAAFPSASAWSDPDALSNALWADPQTASLRDQLLAMIGKLPDVVITERKNFTAFSGKVQFAAARPLKSGGLVLGIALEPTLYPRLTLPVRESWSDRLKSSLTITIAHQIDADLQGLLAQARERS